MGIWLIFLLCVDYETGRLFVSLGVFGVYLARACRLYSLLRRLEHVFFKPYVYLFSACIIHS